jgi:Ran GTPase-activating protein (RanGAP) involved in mRNA processing and transport
MRSLERIALKGCPLVPQLITSFLSPLFAHSQLKHLNMERNQVTDDMICNLVESGALDMPSLESLNLRFNKIGSRGAAALASSSSFSNLKWINLKMNQIGDDGAVALAERLEGNCAMRLLNLRRQMPPLTDSAAVAFARVLRKNSTLEQLRLRQNRIGDAGAAALAKEVAGHVDMLQRFHGYGARLELDLEQNRIKESGAEALLQSLDGISRAVRVELLLHGNPVNKSSLAKAGTQSCEDPRLLFTSKAEGLLW